MFKNHWFRLRQTNTGKMSFFSCICIKRGLAQGICNDDVACCRRRSTSFPSTDTQRAHCSLHQGYTHQLGRMTARNLTRPTSDTLHNISPLRPTYALYYRPLEIHEHCLPSNVGGSIHSAVLLQKHRGQLHRYFEHPLPRIFKRWKNFSIFSSPFWRHVLVYARHALRWLA